MLKLPFECHKLPADVHALAARVAIMGALKEIYDGASDHGDFLTFHPAGAGAEEHAETDPCASMEQLAPVMQSNLSWLSRTGHIELPTERPEPWLPADAVVVVVGDFDTPMPKAMLADIVGLPELHMRAVETSLIALLGWTDGPRDQWVSKEMLEDEYDDSAFEIVDYLRAVDLLEVQADPSGVDEYRVKMPWHYPSDAERDETAKALLMLAGWPQSKA